MFSLTHRLRDGLLIVSLDGAPIFNEQFSRAKLAIQQTTTWDPVTVSAGRHTLRAKVIGENGTSWTSDAYPVELERARPAAFRIRFKGERLVFEPS